MNIHFKIALWSLLYAVVYILLNLLPMNKFTPEIPYLSSMPGLLIWVVALAVITLIFGVVMIAQLELPKLAKAIWISVVVIFSLSMGALSASLAVLTTVH